MAARHAAREARQARADERAARLAPVIKALKGAGVTSLNGIATALNARGVVTPSGGAQWHATQVRRVLARLVTDAPRYATSAAPPSGALGGRFQAK